MRFSVLIIFISDLEFGGRIFPKYEEQLEHKIAKAQLEVLKKDAIEAMETQKMFGFISYNIEGCQSAAGVGI